jgi:hypothetical protein
MTSARRVPGVHPCKSTRRRLGGIVAGSTSTKRWPFHRPKRATGGVRRASGVSATMPACGSVRGQEASVHSSAQAMSPRECL